MIKPFDTLRTAWTSLLRGDVDMVTDVPPDAVEFIRNEEVRVVSFGRRYQYLVALNCEKTPFDSPLVRRALNAAIDRAGVDSGCPPRTRCGIDRTVCGPSIGLTTTRSPRTGSTRAWRSLSLIPRGSEPIRDPTGPQTRFRFTCLIPENFSVLERVALEVQKQLYNVGRRYAVRGGSYRRSSTARIREGRFDAMLIDMISGPTVGRSYMFWRSARRFPGGLNFFGTRMPKLNAFST